MASSVTFRDGANSQSTAPQQEATANNTSTTRLPFGETSFGNTDHGTRRRSHPSNLSLTRTSRAQPLDDDNSAAPAPAQAPLSLRERRAAGRTNNSIHQKRLENLTQLHRGLGNQLAVFQQATRRAERVAHRQTEQERAELRAARCVALSPRVARLLPPRRKKKMCGCAV